MPRSLKNCVKHCMSDKKLNIPIELIPDLSSKDRYLFESISQLNERFDVVERKTDEQTIVLNQILTQSKLTNGRVTRNETDIIEIRSDIEQIKPAIVKVKVASKLLTNKYFWIGAAILVLIIAPILTSAFSPAELLSKMFGL